MSRFETSTDFQLHEEIDSASPADKCPPVCKPLTNRDLQFRENSTPRKNSAQFEVLDINRLPNPANPAPLRGSISANFHAGTSPRVPEQTGGRVAVRGHADEVIEETGETSLSSYLSYLEGIEQQ